MGSILGNYFLTIESSIIELVLIFFILQSQHVLLHFNFPLTLQATLKRENNKSNIAEYSHLVAHSEESLQEVRGTNAVHLSVLNNSDTVPECVGFGQVVGAQEYSTVAPDLEQELPHFPSGVRVHLIRGRVQDYNANLQPYIEGILSGTFR